MKLARLAPLLAAPLLLFTSGGAPAARGLDSLVQAVLLEPDDEPALEALRSAGPAGLVLLIEARRRADLSGAALARVDRAIDRVAAQRGALDSGLYWYTDLGEAEREAARSGRPILSLRMLGRLTDELSCANSRLFRTVLYPDPAVGALLRERFVLHWSSEREVPLMTIDFGDGRRLRRTVTGNSAHYVLDAEGRVIDVIPGLLSPHAFVERLEWALQLPDASAHAARAGAIGLRWQNELERSGVSPRALARGKSSAERAVMIAVSKAAIEAPLLIPPAELARLTNEEGWDRLVRLEPPVELSRATLERIQIENPALDATKHAAMVEKLKQSLARDTVQNEYRLHRRIHEYLAGRAVRPGFEEMNGWVYSELFATPASDPWLGLFDETVYTGLSGGGVIAR
jgi:hypothetical protein